MTRSSYLTLALTGALAAGVATAQPAWTNNYVSPTATGDCSGLPAAIASDTSVFKITPIISRTIFTDPQPARVTKLAFWLPPGATKANIFVGERGGTAGNGGASPARISYYDANANPPTLKVIGTFPQAYIGFSESGVLGLAVNPMTFDQDNFLYVLYSRGASNVKSDTSGWRLSRFKLDPVTRMMDMGSEKTILHIPAGNVNRWHTGTSLRFDNFGNLYIGAADNEATAMGPANTADLRGGILRIKPDTTDPRGYKIPAGNFGEYWASQWEAKGLAARAALYRDTSVVRPEIYVKGSRNPYSFGVDPNRLGWLAWAECGPDQQRAEEHNFTTKPAFSGWPFWAGYGVRQQSYAQSYDEPNEPKGSAWATYNPASMDTLVPINNWDSAKGVDTLPPMHQPYHTLTSGCAMGGPVIRYDGRVANPNKFPPHLDNVIISSTQAGGSPNITTWHGIKIDTATGKTIGSAQTVFTMPRASSGPTIRNSSETVMGPDGMLYIVDQSENCCGQRSLNNNEGVIRVSYAGTCQDPGLYPTAISAPKGLPTMRSAQWLRVGTSTFSITAPGVHEAAILDVAGRTVQSFRGEGHKTYNLPALGAGIHVLRVKTSSGIVTSPLAAGL